jgi:NADPH-dependent 2,4-dienoyl-CoA reductase/sulfur reductase-like enzyme
MFMHMHHNAYVVNRDAPSEARHISLPYLVLSSEVMMATGKARNVLILGAGYGGLMAALRLSRRAGSQVRVTVVNGSYAFVERIRLHQAVCGQTLPVRSISKLLARRGATLRPGWVRTIDRERRSADVDGERISYDSLLVALGSHTDRSGVPGASEHAHTLDAEGMLRLRAALRSLSPGARVVVVGGGLTAIEAASELARELSAATRHPGNGWKHRQAALRQRASLCPERAFAPWRAGRGAEPDLAGGVGAGTHDLGLHRLRAVSMGDGFPGPLALEQAGFQSSNFVAAMQQMTSAKPRPTSPPWAGLVPARAERASRLKG